VADAVAAIGTDTPDAAVKELVAAALNFDVRRIIELTPPDEARALHEYAPLFLDDAQQSAQKFKKDKEVSISLDKLETSVSGSGSTRQVAITAFAVSGSTADGAFSIAHDGTCTTFTFPGDAKPTKTCVTDAKAVLDTLGLGAVSSLATLDKTLGVTVVEVDGHWYVSPTRTSLGLFVGMLRPLDQKKLHDTLTSLFDLLGTSATTHLEIIGQAVDSSVGPTSASTSPSAYSRCYGADNPAGCFADAVASGEIAGSDVPIEFRFDCFGTYAADRSSMSATELAAAAARIHACLQPHIDAGEVNVADVPPEILKPECVGEVNPYSLADKSDAGALGKLHDCAYVG
jgi:hypothetical protein